MRIIIKALMAPVVLAVFTSCYNPSSPKKISAYKPVLMDRASLDKAITYSEHEDIKNTGKLIIDNALLYIPENQKGVHVFDNSDPANPRENGFINIPGVQVIYVKDNTLYADNATDIITLDISDLKHPKILNRIASELPGLNPPDNLPLDTAVNSAGWPKNTVVVGWQKIK